VSERFSRLAWVLLLTPAICYSITFTNGSFEEGPSSSLTSLPVGSALLVGWQVVNGGIEAVTAAYWPPADGLYSLDLNGVHSPGGVCQTFDTISGATYQVTFELAGSYAWGPNYLARVSAAGTTQDYASVATVIWSNRTFVFTAVSNATTLSFVDITPDGSGMNGGPTLDDVRVAQTPAFTAPLCWPAGGCRLSLALPANGICSIQTASNLFVNPTPWEELTNFVIVGTPVEFTDSSATNHPARFYRVIITEP